MDEDEVSCKRERGGDLCMSRSEEGVIAEEEVGAGDSELEEPVATPW